MFSQPVAIPIPTHDKLYSVFGSMSQLSILGGIGRRESTGRTSPFGPIENCNLPFAYRLFGKSVHTLCIHVLHFPAPSLQCTDPSIDLGNPDRLLPRFPKLSPVRYPIPTVRSFTLLLLLLQSYMHLCPVVQLQCSDRGMGCLSSSPSLSFGSYRGLNCCLGAVDYWSIHAFV